jgi:hypothetical protein
LDAGSHEGRHLGQTTHCGEGGEALFGAESRKHVLLAGTVVAKVGGNWVGLVHSLSKGTVDGPGCDLVVVLGGVVDWLLVVRIQGTIESKLGSFLL